MYNTDECVHKAAFAFKDYIINMRKAESELKKLIREGNETGNIFLIGISYFYLSAANYHVKDYDKAILYGIKSCAFLSKTSEYTFTFMAYNNLGIAYFSQENYQFALSSYEAAYALVKKHRISGDNRYMVISNITDCYIRLGDYKACIKILKDVIALASKKAQENEMVITAYSLNLADCYERSGEYDKAMATLNQLESHIENTPEEIWSNLYTLLRSYVHFESGDKKGGRKYTDRLLEAVKYPEEAYMLYECFERLAHVLINEGEYERAKKVVNIISDYAAVSHRTVDKLAAARVCADYYEKTGDIKAAFEQYREVDRLYSIRLTEYKNMQLTIHKRMKEADTEIHKLNSTLTESNKKITALSEEATTDGLTGLLNKTAVKQRLTSECVENSGVLMILDLDSFKLVNDIYGHEAGDKILRAFADLLKGSFRAKDCLGRIGGDEFIAFLQGNTNEDSVTGVVRRLNEELVKEAKRLLDKNMTIPLGVSSGAVMTLGGEEYEELFKKADSALMTVKQTGKHNCLIWKDEKGSGNGAPIQDLKKVNILLKERNVDRRAMLLEQDSFRGVYRYLLRVIKRYDENAFRVLFTIKKKEKGLDDETFDKACDALGDIILSELRNSDLITRISPTQYFLLLPMVAEESIDRVINRLMSAWKKTEFAKSTKLSCEPESVE